MGALAHPVGLRAETEQGGFGAELAEEVAFGLGFGGGASPCWFESGRCVSPGLGGLKVAAPGFAAGQSNAYIGGLDSRAVGEEEIAEGYRGGDPERGVG